VTTSPTPSTRRPTPETNGGAWHSAQSPGLTLRPGRPPDTPATGGSSTVTEARARPLPESTRPPTACVERLGASTGLHRCIPGGRTRRRASGCGRTRRADVPTMYHASS
jgi:hypothetical protein